MARAWGTSLQGQQYALCLGELLAALRASCMLYHAPHLDHPARGGHGLREAKADLGRQAELGALLLVHAPGAGAGARAAGVCRMHGSAETQYRALSRTMSAWTPGRVAHIGACRCTAPACGSCSSHTRRCSTAQQRYISRYADRCCMGRFNGSIAVHCGLGKAICFILGRRAAHPFRQKWRGEVAGLPERREAAPCNVCALYQVSRTIRAVKL